MVKLKKIISTAVAGLALAAPFMAYGWTTGLLNAQNSELPGGSIFNIITNILDWLLALIGVIGVIGFAIAGILYLTSAGDEGRIETAKKAMTYSIIGVIVAISGLVIIYAASNMLSGFSGF